MGTGPCAVLLCALSKEFEPLQARVTAINPLYPGNQAFFSGWIGEIPVVIGKTGMGKVSAAHALTLLHLKSDPAVVIFSGTAGALNPGYQPGDVIIGTRLGFHDFGILRPSGFESFSRTGWMLPDGPLLEAARQSTEDRMGAAKTGTQLSGRAVHFGAILTGDTAIADPGKKLELAAAWGADAVEMEGAVVAELCQQWNIPWIVVRGLSDTAGENIAAEWKAFASLAAERAAEVAVGVLKAWWAHHRIDQE
jgi:adenosylhomocysteine nucleosidase